MNEYNDRRIDEQFLSERIAVLRSQIDEMYRRIFSEDSVNSASFEAPTLGLDKTWKDLMPSLAQMNALNGLELNHIFIRKPFENLEEKGTIFLVYTHFCNDIQETSANVNFSYSLEKSAVVISSDLKPGISIEREDKVQNELREGMRLQMLSEVLAAISSTMFS